MDKSLGRIDWNETAQQIHNRVRGTFPWPGAHTVFRGQPFKIHQTRLIEGSGSPGQVMESPKRLVVGCGTGCVEIIRAQLAGKRAQSGTDLINGARIQPGECFG